MTSWRTNRKTRKRFVPRWGAEDKIDKKYESLIGNLKRKHKSGKDIGAYGRGDVSDVWIIAVRKLSKQSPESVAEWLSQELGRTVTVDGMYSQLSRYRNTNVGKVQEWILGGPSDREVGVTVPTPFEATLTAEAKRERMENFRDLLTNEEREIYRENNAAAKRIKRVNAALEEGRISKQDYPRYISGELKLPRGRNVKAKAVTTETVKVESSQLPSDEFFDDSGLAGEL